MLLLDEEEDDAVPSLESGDEHLDGIHNKCQYHDRYSHIRRKSKILHFT